MGSSLTDEFPVTCKQAKTKEHRKGDPNIIQDQIQYNSDDDDDGSDVDSDKY